MIRFVPLAGSCVPARLALAIAFAALSTTAQAQSFTDGAFTTGWTQATYVNPYGCSGGSLNPVSSGGNPDGYLHVSDYSCGFVHNANLSPFTWNPSTQGAITSVSFYSDVSAAGAMAFLTVLRQNNSYFVRSLTYAYAADGWLAFNAPETNTAWCNLYATWSAGGNFNCGAAQVDFTTTGGTIEFGIASANSGGSAYSADGGIDNFNVTLTTIPAVVAAPEPASLLLLGTGMMGMLGVVRRRHRR